MSAIDIVLVAIALVAVGVAVACALQLKSLRAELRERGDSSAETLAALEQANNALDALNVALAETRRTANAIAQQQTTDAAVEQQRYLTIAREFSQAGDRMDDLRRETAQQLGANREGIEHRLDKVRETVDAQLGAIRKDNNVQLDQMRATVDEKLSRTLNDRLSASFKQVSDQLEAVYKGLGDMQSIATGVGDLKRVLGNVKARGILGEVQLGAILTDILTPDQYLENVATKPGASERVEFAVKLPVDEAIRAAADRLQIPGRRVRASARRPGVGRCGGRCRGTQDARYDGEARGQGHLRKVPERARDDQLWHSVRAV